MQQSLGFLHLRQYVVIVIALFLKALPTAGMFVMLSQGGELLLDPGQTASLRCEFQQENFSLFHNPIIWVKTQLKESKQINMMGNIEDPFQQTGRFSVDMRDSSPTHALLLRIKELSTEDSGNYTCEVRGPGNRIVGTITYFVYIREPVDSVEMYRGYRPINADYTGSLQGTASSISITEDIPAAISCLSTGGYPPPEMDIFMGEQNITGLFSLRHDVELSGELGLQSQLYATVRWADYFVVTADDDGKAIKCAANVAGFPPSICSYVLHVSYAPVIECEPATAYLGQRNAYIACTVKARPRAKVMYWGMDDNSTLIRNSVEYWSKTMDKSPLCLETHLYFHTASEDKFRIYTLTAENDVGVTDQQVPLIQKQKVSLEMTVIYHPEEVDVYNTAPSVVQMAPGKFFKSSCSPRCLSTLRVLHGLNFIILLLIAPP